MRTERMRSRNPSAANTFAEIRRAAKNKMRKLKKSSVRRRRSLQSRYVEDALCAAIDCVQMKTDLDEALERAKTLAEKLDQANEQIETMGVEINQLRLGMMKCKCIGPDS